MKKFHLLLRGALALLLLVLQSCANYDLNYSDAAVDSIIPTPGAIQPAHQIYLVGNLGTADQQTFRALKMQLSSATKESTLVLLGNNLPEGMAPKFREKENAEAKRHLDHIVSTIKSFPGEIYIIAGNTDWKTYGLKGLKRQKDYLEKQLDRDDVFLPDPGCGDPEEVEIRDDLVLVLVDSQWWLEDWQGQPEVNADCDVKSRTFYWQYYEDIIKGNRTKNIVIASHHPPYSNGYYGGQYPLKRHIFPLTFLGEGLYVPLPLIGTLASTIRSGIGSEQEIAHPKYREFRNVLVNSARKNGSFIFASAHENNMQYLEKDDQYYIIAGAGQEVHATRTGNGAEFAYAAPGLARLDFFDDGASDVTYLSLDEQPELVFSKHVKEAGRKPVASEEKDFTEYRTSGTTVTKEMSQDDFSRSKFGRFLWGDHYRDVYNAVIDVPVLDLETYGGGVVPVKRGGGYQTNSLRLENEAEQQFAMRSIDKDPSRTVPYPFNESFVLDLVKDQFSSSHPLGAVVLPPLADAVNIYHTNPALYYAPKQPLLGMYNEDFGASMYLLEERPDDEVWKQEASFGKPDEIVSTSNAIEEILEEHDHVADRTWLTRSRLFDIMIGDWDRHDDQWRFSVFEEDDLHVYRPIPRDRDQTFSKYDGFLMVFIRSAAPAYRPFRPYSEKIKKIQWTSYGPRHFDATFLNELEWEEWEKEIKLLQTNITDELIERSFKENWPAALYDLNGPEIIKKLKGRRDRMMEYGRDFYELTSKRVDVVGTEQEDLFKIKRLPNGDVHVEVWGMTKDFEIKNRYFERTFRKGETKAIRLYGLEDDDRFELSGESKNSSIKLRILPGLDTDEVSNRSKTGGLFKRTLIYDYESEENKIAPGKDSRLRIKDDPTTNGYNRKSIDYEYDYAVWLPNAGFNPDDGVALGLSTNITTYGFKKDPYSTNHKIGLLYAFATSGWRFNYEGEYLDVMGNWDMRADLDLQSALYTINFYGFGNDSENLEEELGKDYNRVRSRIIHFSPALMRRINPNFYWSVGPTLQSIRVENNQERIIGAFAEDLNPEIFDGVEYLGAEAKLRYANADNVGFPTRGLGFSATGGWLHSLDDSDVQFPYLEGAFTLYRHLDADKKLVLATRIGARHIFDDTFEFFQGSTLGGIGPGSNFRGVRRDRYTGRSVFYQNTDLRWKMLESGNDVLPFSFGLLAGFDHGRVWFDGEDSDTWHYSYGGGFFISPFDLLSINVSVFQEESEGDFRFVVGGGFFF